MRQRAGVTTLRGPFHAVFQPRSQGTRGTAAIGVGFKTSGLRESTGPVLVMLEEIPFHRAPGDQLGKSIISPDDAISQFRTIELVGQNFDH